MQKGFCQIRFITQLNYMLLIFKILLSSFQGCRTGGDRVLTFGHKGGGGVGGIYHILKNT